MAARAHEPAAKTLVKAMSGYMAAQRAISLSVGTDLEIVTKDKQKLALASSRTVTLNRPYKLTSPGMAGSPVSKRVLATRGCR